MARPSLLPAVSIGEKATKNALLIAINDKSRRYNLLFSAAANMRERNKAYLVEPRMVAYLDDVFKNCIAYIVIRPPGSRSERGQGRAQAIVGLITAIEEHAKFFGIKFLQSDFEDGTQQTKTMNYWIERADTGLHGEAVFKEFLTWIEVSDTRQSFREAMGERRSDLKYFTELQRRRYVMTFEGQTILTADGKPLSTDGVGSYSGLEDSFIYVCSARTREVYSTAAAPGEVHHSSFLQGEPIIAGGDWVVENGKLQFINAASGHYRPTTGGMALFLQLFMARINPHAFIQPTFNGPIYKIADYARAGASAPRSTDGERRFGSNWSPTLEARKPA